MDVGYPNRKGYLAPYRTIRYHVAAFQGLQPRGKEEHFNHMHSSLRNVIERTFDVLKKRWNILNFMPPFDFPTQVRIVIACMVLHNFIIEQRLTDEVLEEAEIDETVVEPEPETNDESEDPVNLDETDMAII